MTTPGPRSIFHTRVKAVPAVDDDELLTKAQAEGLITTNGPAIRVINFSDDPTALSIAPGTVVFRRPPPGIHT